MEKTDCLDNTMLSRRRNVFEVIAAVTERQNCELPFYVADLTDVVEKLRIWKKKLPRVEPFYAVKSNSDPVVLRLMVALGFGFDCASKWEIDTVLSFGAKPSDVIYAHPYKSRGFLRHAGKAGVDLMTFDSVDELYKIKETYPQARLVLRFHVPNVQSGFPLNNKFGCRLSSCRHLLETAQQLDLNVVGTSFHVGGLCEQPEAYFRAISMARDIFDIATEVGFKFTILDLGGGYPGHTGSYELFSVMSQEINRALKEFFADDDEVRVIAEPGCYFVCSAFTLCTTIIGKTQTDSEEESESGKQDVQMKYYISDGNYTSFGEGIECYQFRMRPFLSSSEIAERPAVLSKLWGWSCCSSDCIMEACVLPIMEVGEHIVFENMGAYSSCLASNFNGFPQPTTIYIYGSKKCPDLRKMISSTSVSLTDKLCHAQMNGFICDDDSNSDICRNG